MAAVENLAYIHGKSHDALDTMLEFCGLLDHTRFIGQPEDIAQIIPDRPLLIIINDKLLAQSSPAESLVQIMQEKHRLGMQHIPVLVYLTQDTGALDVLSQQCEVNNIPLFTTDNFEPINVENVLEQYFAFR